MSKGSTLGSTTSFTAICGESINLPIGSSAGSMTSGTEGVIGTTVITDIMTDIGAIAIMAIN